MTGFGGWEMPLDYGSVVAEHRAVRSGCGVFDLSHLGMLRVTGADAEGCVQAAFTNDAAALSVGGAHYTLCLDEHGGITDDLICYRLPWGFFVVPNAANAEGVRTALAEAAAGDCEVAEAKPGLACLAVQGPQAAEMVTDAGLDVAGLGFFECRPLAMPSPGPSSAGAPVAGPTPEGGVLARTGYTGELGYELFCEAERADHLWDRLMGAGASPVGLGARDTLRLEMGYPLHGQDISPGVSPVEARLSWAVKPGTGFRGEKAFVAAKQAGPSRRLFGLLPQGRRIPRPHCGLTSADGEAVGEVTSGTFSPTLGQGIAMGYVDQPLDEGHEVIIDVRGRSLPSTVTRPPFVEASPKG